MNAKHVIRTKYFEYGITLLVMLLILGICIMGRPLQSLDELWQYSFESNISQGLMPYRDMNLAVTPLSMLWGGLILKILDNQLIVYRLLGTINSTICMMLFYDIMRKMNVDKRIAFCFSVYAGAFYCPYFTYDYNYLELLILLLIMDLLLGLEEKKAYSGRKWLIIGGAGGCAVLIKQSTGMVIFIAVFLLSVILYSRKNRRCALYFGIGCFFPLGLCAGGILYCHIQGQFWDYVFGGLASFAQHNRIGISIFLFHSGLLCTLEALLAAAIAVIGIVRVVRSRKTDSCKKRLILIWLSFAGSVVIYPITDNTHFVIALLPFLLVGICEMKMVKEGQQKIPMWLPGAIAVGGIGLSVWTISGENIIWSELPYYKGIRIEQSVEETVWEVMRYLELYQGKSVYILDGTAVLYKIPMGLYDKDYDICLAGTWGSRSAEEMAQALLREKGIMLLAADGYGVNWQVPENFLTYIQQNAVCIDHISKYDVYVAKDEQN